MGGCTSIEQDYEGAVSSSENASVNHQLHKLNRKDAGKITLLLLGTGESGKSTFYRQIKLLHMKFNNIMIKEEERIQYRPLIFRQLLHEMCVLITNSRILGNHLDSQKNIAYAKWLLAVPPDGSAWNSDCITVISLLWQDSGIQKTYAARGTTFHIADSSAYFFDRITTYTADFIPTKSDLVRVRIRTTGIEETPFEWESFKFTLIDCGGQRTERRKWLHLFQNKISAIIYCVAMSDYDTTLREDHSTNRLLESIELFNELVNGPWFKNTFCFLLLNKQDIFEEKIKTKDPKDYGFTDYKGGCDSAAAKKYIRRRFTSLFPNRDRLMINESIAIKLDNVRFVFEDIKAKMVKNVIENFGEAWSLQDI